MKYWESSALVPLLLDEPQSVYMTAVLRDDPVLVTWWGSALECTSGIRRREREGLLDTQSANQALALLETLASRWTEVLPSVQLRSHASRLLATHPLRAADSLQLAAAITWRRDPGAKPEFVCSDTRLADAATREGFSCLPA